MTLFARADGAVVRCGACLGELASLVSVAGGKTAVQFGDGWIYNDILSRFERSRHAKASERITGRAQSRRPHIGVDRGRRVAMRTGLVVARMPVKALCDRCPNPRTNKLDASHLRAEPYAAGGVESSDAPAVRSRRVI